MCAFNAVARLVRRPAFPLRAFGARRVYPDFGACSAFVSDGSFRPLYAPGPAFRTSMVASLELTIA